jgi:hypothetical protein
MVIHREYFLELQQSSTFVNREMNTFFVVKKRYEL